MSTQLKVGDVAPNFKLEATTGGQVSVVDYKHKKNVLVVFYPLDFTGG